MVSDLEKGRKVLKNRASTFTETYKEIIILTSSTIGISSFTRFSQKSQVNLKKHK